MSATSKRHHVKWVLAIILFVALSVVFLPWSVWLEKRLEQYLEQKGFAGTQLALDHVGFSGITFSDIHLGGKKPLDLKNLTIGYSFWDEENSGAVNGKWHVHDLQIKDTPIELPLMNGEGVYSLHPGMLSVQGQFRSADKTHHASFAIDYAFDDATPSILTVIEAAMPWYGGVISTRDVKVPLGAEKDIHLAVTVKHVLVDELLKSVTGNRASATGVISGTLPVTILPKGGFILRAGKLDADQPGTVAMTPDAIPGDNAQVALVREVLQNFHYQLLSAELSNDRSNRLSMLLKLEGRNPEVQDGREVKLNVMLTGNVLDLMQQSLSSIADPRKFLESGHDANLNTKP